MLNFLLSLFGQVLAFLPLGLAITISFRLLQATDMTLDGSFVLGAGTFALCITHFHLSPLFSMLLAILAGSLAGLAVSLMQYKQKIDSLLAGILATFMLTSGNLILMGRPNISLLGKTTLFSSFFNISDAAGYTAIAVVCFTIFACVYFLLSRRFGLVIKALGDNPYELDRMGYPVELYRCLGFMLTNGLSATAGCITAQTVGYADISMGLGMTLTGLGAIILGEKILGFARQKITKHHTHPLAVISNTFAIGTCLLGVTLYFFMVNFLLRMGINPLYLKVFIGLLLVFFLRAAQTHTLTRGTA